jgi:hypothetical protein
MTPEEIYVSLLDEGVDVRRPVPALPVGDDTYVILQPDDYDPADERWEFPPGSVVVVEQRQTSDGPVRAAVRRAWTGRIPA